LTGFRRKNVASFGAWCQACAASGFEENDELHADLDRPERWLRVVKGAEWKNFPDLRRTFPHAYQVMVASGRPLVVFNVSGNQYRLICAVHFDKQRVFVLKFMTHAEYSKDRWKHSL
jgi:mRNA interferase HigB